MHARFIVVSIGAALASGAADADCTPVSLPPGMRAWDPALVPLNAAFPVPRIRDDDLADEDGIAVVNDIDGDGFNALRPARELAPNERVEVCADGECAEIVATTEFDFEPPAKPRVRVDEVRGEWWPPIPFGECPTNGANHTVVELQIEQEDDERVAGFEIVRIAAAERARVGVAVVRSDNAVPNHAGFDDRTALAGTATYEVRAVDFGGNKSEPTMVDADLGCPGSCASVDGATFLALLALLRLRRARVLVLALPFVVAPAHASSFTPPTAVLGSAVAPMNAAFAFDVVDAPSGTIAGRAVSVSTFTDDDGFVFVTTDEAILPDRDAVVCGRPDACARVTTRPDAVIDVDAPQPPLVTVAVERAFSDAQRPDAASLVTLDLVAADAADVGDLVTQYEIVRTIDGARVRLPLATSTWGVPAPPSRVTDATTDAGRAVYEVRALDAAGNRSDPTAAVVDVGCTQTPQAPLVALALAVLVRRRR